jgi:hypothetical protein
MRLRKNNSAGVGLFRKINFRFEENPRNAASRRLNADRRLFYGSPVLTLLAERRRKEAEKGVGA